MELNRWWAGLREQDGSKVTAALRRAKMKIGTGGLVAIAGLILSSFGLFAFGQGTPVTVSLTNVNGDPIVNVGGESVYAGVYGGTSNLPGANTGIICDDFNDEVSVPQSWSAIAYNVSTIGTSTPITDVLFGSGTKGYTNVGIAGYAEIAYLVNMSFASSGNPTLQGNISEAIWAITDPGLSGVDSAAQTLDSQAAAYASSTSDNMSQYTNLVIYTPTPLGQQNQPQEMWSTVPEGGAAWLYLLLVGIACFGAMRFSPRGQSGKHEAI